MVRGPVPRAWTKASRAYPGSVEDSGEMWSHTKTFISTWTRDWRILLHPRLTLCEMVDTRSWSDGGGRVVRV